MRTSWQKFATLIPKITRDRLAKQDQAGSYMWVIVKIMLNILTNEIGFLDFILQENTVPNCADK